MQRFLNFSERTSQNLFDFFILQVEYHYSGGQGEVGQYKSTPSKGVDISWIHKSEAWL